MEEEEEQPPKAKGKGAATKAKGKAEGKAEGMAKGIAKAKGKGAKGKAAADAAEAAAGAVEETGAGGYELLCWSTPSVLALGSALASSRVPCELWLWRQLHAAVVPRLELLQGERERLEKKKERAQVTPKQLF